jgi:hypothetical protein
MHDDREAALAGLGRPSRDEMSWRDREAQVFRRVLELTRGKLPGLDGLTDEDLRRLGYLAEAAALLLEASDPKALLALAAAARARLPADDHRRTIPLVPGSKPRSGRQVDELAAAWGIWPGLDVSRYRAEAPALDA